MLRAAPLGLLGGLTGGLVLVFVLLAAPEASAAAGASTDSYRTVFGISGRLAVWIVAELHLMFGAFVLGVPIFAVLREIVGFTRKDPEEARRYDALAYEFTKLLSAAFATTAALGGLLSFVLYSAYPKLMGHLTGVFHPSFYVYGLTFFGEAFSLYTYYYGWHRFRSGRAKLAHIGLGLMLNVFGTALMVIANSWTTYMMSPPGLEPGAAGMMASHWQAGEYIGPFWEAFTNWLWMPLNIHRLLANVAFGGAICGAYAAVRFLTSREPKARAHYDWMGYVGNLIAIASLLPLPFAGYYLGREIYSFSATMGQDMMGGTFSWTFIIQAVLVGSLFIAGNYYLWSGLSRIPGGERYRRYVGPMIVALFVCFAIWLTPHNLPLGGLEKKLGLMPAKNAVIQLILITTFVGFLMYRRANTAGPREDAGKTLGQRVVAAIAVALGVALLASYMTSAQLSDANPEVGQYLADSLPFMFTTIPLGEDATWAATLRWTLVAQMAALVLSLLLFARGRTRGAQELVVGATVFLATGWLFQHGFSIMEMANPLVRQVAVCQVLMVLACFLVVGAYDGAMFRGATRLGAYRWGQMHTRSQLALVLLCLLFVLNMGLMGFIRSGLRKGWHVVSVMKDTSEWAGTPSNLEMAIVVTGISLTFLALIALVFWIANLGDRPEDIDGEPSHA